VVIISAAGLGLYLTSHDRSAGSGQTGLNTASAGASPRLSTVEEVSAGGTPARAGTGAGGSTGSAEAGAPPTGTSRLASAMLTPAAVGAGWSGRTAPNPPSRALCKAPLGFSGGDRASVLLVRSPDGVALQQDAFRGTKGQAAKVLAGVRTSAGTCSEWTGDENDAAVTYSFTTIANAKAIGDGSAEYRVERTSGSLTVHVVQVFVVQNEVLSILSYATLTPTTDADVAAAESLATQGAQKLATAP
jgi:hypothetical protein